MRSGRSDGDIERRLEWELARNARRLRGPSPHPSQSAYHRFAQNLESRRMVSSMATASTKLAAGLVAACLLGVGGAVAATAATGSANPVVWSRTVTRVVDQQKSTDPWTVGVASTAGPTPRSSAPPPTPAMPASRPTPAGSAVHPSRDPSRDENRTGRRGTPPASANGGATTNPSAVQPTSVPGHSASPPAHPSPSPTSNMGRGAGNPSVEP